MNADTVLTIGIPSRRRIESLRHCINSIAATVGMDFRICVGFGDDVEGFRFLPNYPFVQRTNFVPRGYYVKDTNRTFDFMRETGDVDYFVITQDDSEFVSPGWGPRVIDLLHENFANGEGAIEMFNPAGFSNIVSRARVFDQFAGKILPEEYRHYFADSVRRQQLVDRGQFAALQYQNPLDMICWHPTYATINPTGLEAREKWYEVDKETYRRWALKRQHESQK